LLVTVASPAVRDKHVRGVAAEEVSEHSNMERKNPH
jgi:hypothetical protein